MIREIKQNLLILFPILLSLLLSGISPDKHSFEAIAQERSNYPDLIVGEVFGRVNPDNLMERIQNGYYPVIGKNSNAKIELFIKSPNKVIYRLIYPNNATDLHPQRIVFQFFETEQSLATAVITDQVDFAITESNYIAEEIHKSTSAYYIRHRFKKPNFVKMLAYNNRNQILDSENLRKALTYSVDKEYIYNNILQKQAFFADGPISSQSENHVSGLKSYKFDPKNAIELILAENWRDANNDGILDKNRQPFRISLAYEKGVYLDQQIARIIKIGWNKLGVDVIRNPLTKKEIEQRLKSRNYDVILLNYQFDDTYESFKKHFESTSADNFLGYKSATTDKYFRLYKTVDPESKDVMFHAIQNQINKDHPAAFMFFLWLERYFVNRVKFQNYRSSEENLLPFTEWIYR